MSEIFFLQLVLGFGYSIAPYFSNRFFLNHSRIYKFLHLFSVLMYFFVWRFDVPILSFIWIVFSLFGFLLLFLQNKENLFHKNTWLGFLPLGFSMVSTIWYVSASNQFYLLGFDLTWSLYAAVHGCFIGWLFLSGVVYVSKKNPDSKVIPFLILFIAIFFLIIAIGIYQSKVLKRIGVVSYCLLIPSVILYVRTFLKKKVSKYLMGFCFSLVLCTLFLAICYEFPWIFGFDFQTYRLMTFLHGGINALVVVPLFLFALDFEYQSITNA